MRKKFKSNSKPKLDRPNA